MLDSVSIGMNAKDARKSSGYSKATVAEFLKLDQCLISDFENGHSPNRSDLLERLACLYGINISDFERSESSQVEDRRIGCGLNTMTLQDMEAIHDINRIAMNLFFMSDLAECAEDES